MIGVWKRVGQWASGMALSVGLGLMMGAATTSARAEPLTPTALAELERLGAPTLSPDGMKLAFTITGERLAWSRPTLKLMLAHAGDLPHAVVLMEGEGGLDGLTWAEDGKSLYYLAAAPGTGTMQLWNIPTDGRPRRQVTRYPLGILSYRLADHDRVLITAHDADPDCPDLACSRARFDRDAAKAKERGAEGSGLMYRDGASPRYLDSFIDQRFVTLFQRRLIDGTAPENASAVVRGYRYDVTERNFTPQMDFSVAPDGRTVWAALRPSGSNQGDEPPKTIYRAAVGEGSDEQRYVPLIADAGRSVYRPRVSPDGRWLAYLRAEGSEHTAPRITIWVRDLQSNVDREVAPGLDILVSELGWSSSGDKLYAIGPQGTRVSLFEIPLATPDSYAVVPSAASVLQWSSRGDKLALLESGLTQPPEVAVVEAGAAHQRISRTTYATERAAPYALGALTHFQVKGWNGDSVEGMLLTPAHFDPQRRYPVVWLLHGGPNGVSSDVWSAGVLAPQLFAARGYAVVMVNPHGSAGYGTAFGRAVLRHWGDRPLEDLKATWAHVKASVPFVDASRACAVGGSYGGYLTLLLAGQWNEPWACFVDGQGVLDLRSFYLANDITTYDRLSFGPFPWADADLEAQNPVTFASRWAKPMFIIAGGRDYRVPTEQTLGAYKAAVLRNVPAQLLMLPDAGHGQFSLPDRIRTMAETLDWLDRWTAPAAASAPPAR